MSRTTVAEGFHRVMKQLATHGLFGLKKSVKFEGYLGAPHNAEIRSLRRLLRYLEHPEIQTPQQSRIQSNHTLVTAPCPINGIVVKVLPPKGMSDDTKTDSAFLQTGKLHRGLPLSLLLGSLEVPLPCTGQIKPDLARRLQAEGKVMSDLSEAEFHQLIDEHVSGGTLTGKDLKHFLSSSWDLAAAMRFAVNTKGPAAVLTLDPGINPHCHTIDYSAHSDSGGFDEMSYHPYAEQQEASLASYSHLSPPLAVTLLLPRKDGHYYHEDFVTHALAAYTPITLALHTETGRRIALNAADQRQGEICEIACSIAWDDYVQSVRSGKNPAICDDLAQRFLENWQQLNAHYHRLIGAANAYLHAHPELAMHAIDDNPLKQTEAKREDWKTIARYLPQLDCDLLTGDGKKKPALHLESQGKGQLLIPTENGEPISAPFNSHQVRMAAAPYVYAGDTPAGTDIETLLTAPEHELFQRYFAKLLAEQALRTYPDHSLILPTTPAPSSPKPQRVEMESSVTQLSRRP